MTHAETPLTPWYERAEQTGISLELIAAATGKSFATVYAYKVGRRRAPEGWLLEVERLLGGQTRVSVVTDKLP